MRHSYIGLAGFADVREDTVTRMLVAAGYQAEAAGE